MTAGKCYLERGLPALTARFFAVAPKRLGPRNVMIRRADGSRTVRGFRGLRLPRENR